MTIAFPEPTEPAGSRTEVFLRYLAFFRGTLTEKLRALPDGELRASRLPSGWTPLELLKHLIFVERRWVEWRFEGVPVPDPWGDQKDGRWYVTPDETLEDLLGELGRRGARSDAIIRAHGLDEAGAPGERWDGNPPATLERVLFHLLQEYARHLGHLDIVAEIAGGPLGE
ncbi:MAG: DinB family protein [Trebonia sp.]